AGLEQREPAARRGFRRGVENGRRAGGAGLAPVADTGKRGDTTFDQRRRWLHVHDFAAARIADRPGAADEQHVVLVDLERRVVDAVVIILRPVEHDGAPLEGVRVLRAQEIAVAELGRYYTRLHDGGIEQVATEHLEAGLVQHRLFVRLDHVRVGDL